MKVLPLLIGANILNYVTVTHFVQVKKKWWAKAGIFLVSFLPSYRHDHVYRGMDKFSAYVRGSFTWNLSLLRGKQSEKNNLRTFEHYRILYGKCPF